MLQLIIYTVSLLREGDIPEAILKGFLAVDSELKTYGNATELTGSTGILIYTVLIHTLKVNLI